MAIYKLSATGVILNTSGKYIPADPNNRDWQDYIEWTNEGNVADPADIIPITGGTATVQESVANDIAYGALVKALANHFGLTLEQITTIIAAET